MKDRYIISSLYAAKKRIPAMDWRDSQTLQDAADRLRELQPRVWTYAEMKEMAKDPAGSAALYIETADGKIMPGLILRGAVPEREEIRMSMMGLDFGAIDVRHQGWSSDYYGLDQDAICNSWRAWTGRPDEDIRINTPWAEARKGGETDGREKGT